MRESKNKENIISATMPTGIGKTALIYVIAAFKAYKGEKVLITMPNKVYALCRAFSASNVNFHAVDGSGYRLMADMILAVDKVNAQVGSRLASPFTKWLKYDVERRVLMKKELERMMGDGGLSPNSLEIVAACLKQEGGRSKM